MGILIPVVPKPLNRFQCVDYVNNHRYDHTNTHKRDNMDGLSEYVNCHIFVSQSTFFFFTFYWNFTQQAPVDSF